MSEDQRDDKPKQEDTKAVAAQGPSAERSRAAGQDKGKPGTRGGKPAGNTGKGGRWLAAFLVLLFIGAIAAGGWYGSQWILAERASLAQRLEAQEAKLRALDNEIQRQQEVMASRADLEAVLAETSSRDAALADRMQRLEVAMNDLRDAAEGGRRALMQAEVEYLLRIAADELYLTTDVEAAIYALQAADERLRQLADPRFNPVRESIADHLAQLNAVNIPDIPGMAFKLGTLQRRVESLPLAQQQYAQMQAEEDMANAEAGWWQRFQSGLDRLYGKLVTLQPAEPPKPLLSPEDSFFLRRNLELQFATARAALLRQDPQSYRQSLEIARRWLTEYFDRDDAEVRSLLEDLNGLLAVNLQPDLPDVTGALSTFREITGNGVRD